jgi:hypothetical protein
MSTKDILVTDDLLAQVGLTSVGLRKQIEQARLAAVRAVRAIEERLVRELGGERLRGMQDISAPGSNARFYATRVRLGPIQLERPAPMATRGSEALVLLPVGRLAMARHEMVGQRMVVTHRDASDDDLLVEDVHEFAGTVVHAITRGLEASESSRARFEALEQLAGRLAAAAIAPETPGKRA